jgi:thioredoxin-related protein
MKFPKLAPSIILIFALAFVTGRALAESSPHQDAKPAVKVDAKAAHKSGTAKTDATKSAKVVSTDQPAGTAGEKIHWVSFDKGVQLQKGTTKHLFVDFTATWCGWCKKMEAEAFSDPDVIQYVNANFVPVKVWGDQDSILNIDGYKVSQKDLTQGEFQVTGFPTFWFVSPKKEKLGPVPGYQTKNQLMNILPMIAEYRYDSTRTKQDSTTQSQGQGK